MFCPSCGGALGQRMRYCNRCGSQLVTTEEAAEIEAAEGRLHEEMVDLFWLTVLGLGLILGGMALIKGVLHLSEWILIAYMVLSSTAFAVNFGLSLWQIRRLARAVMGGGVPVQRGQLDTSQLGPVKEQISLEALSSVTEHTTHRLEPASKEPIT